MDPGEINSMKIQENEFASADQHEMKLDELRNELETRAFNLGNAIQSDYPECFTPAELETGQRLCVATQDWLTENEDVRFEAQEYETRLQELKEIAEPARLRRDAFREIDATAPRLIAMAESFARRCDAMAGNPKAASVKADLSRTIQDLNDLLNAKRYEIPKQTISAIEAYLNGTEKWIKTTGK
jgi:molecular chaperone DnaK (HSP70)